MIVLAVAGRGDMWMGSVIERYAIQQDTYMYSDTSSFTPLLPPLSILFIAHDYMQM